MAKLTVEETDRDGLRLRWFREFPSDRPQRGDSSQVAGGQERDEVVEGTRPPEPPMAVSSTMVA